MRAGLAIAACACSAVVGCQSAPRDTLTAPRILTTPYDASSGDVLWAVVPIRNESGTTFVERVNFADKLVAAAEEAQGIRVVPLNRTLGAMRALRMHGVHTPAEARKLAQAMGVDGVLVGSVTAFDPYTPTIGVAVALYARPGAMVGPRSSLTPRELATSPSDSIPAPQRFEDTPLASASLHLDGKNHQVQMDLESFAQGRMRGASALGWKRYLASADLYAEFAAYRTVDELLAQEWLRLARTPPPAAGGVR